VGTSPDPTPTPTPSDPGTPPVVTAAKARGCSAGGPAGLASAAILAAAALLALRRRRG
jgi:uncharacterized protein (TIGR03382 family)